MSQKLIITLILTFAASANAHEALKHAECAPLKAACEKAGYKSKIKSKNINKDCLSKLAKGETVEGVTVTDDMNSNACFAIMGTSGKDHLAKFHNGDKERVPAASQEEN